MDGVDALPVAPKRKQDDSVVARPPKQRKGGAHDTGKKKSASWCEESVARLFFLRYKTELANRFDSKNNNQKKEAYEMLASELSIDVNRVYSAKQVKDKFTNMRSEWALTKPSLPRPTGNDVVINAPAHFACMLEYWGSKDGFRRESLFSTDEGGGIVRFL
ncbi:hypothetical protein H257_08282 [Aphanomyces astaci]|uniref:Myb/SANT-like DNA-binding domain-containing protein n=1 Tax=Aphanomyces astaci TaxID=112090 RepID=W4GGK5_APHAT|nr:hypothetical protein H257_08282 [Aphanomyces astaci]ETV78073.1 hypothetical protein H257_08282 [Aphanomyces astaci]|eukprot:XP_009832410.1 hypothetical protein H257_08282 [Aphanomyces astaci]